MRVAALELSRAPLDPLLLVFDGLPSGSTAEAGPLTSPAAYMSRSNAST
jgi:hypothetical protein